VSGFTTTPNLGLKKPTTGADNDLWGGHLNENADTLDTAVAGKAATVHTHTASQITDFAEATDDRVAALLVQGSNITLAYNDAAGSLTISAPSSGGSYVPIDGSVAMTGPLQLPVGTQSQPAIQFGSSSTGIHSNGTLGDVRIVVGTSGVFQVTGSYITGIVPFAAPVGSQTAPTHTFSGESNTGMYRSGAGILSFSVVGTNRFKIDSNTSQITATYQIVLPATTTALASLNMPHGTAPTTPVNGDVWTTTAGLYARISGATVGPFGAGSAGITTITAGGVLSGGTITSNTGTIGLAVGTGLTSAVNGTIALAAATTSVLGGVLVPAGGGLGLASGTLSNSGVLSVDSATGALLIGAGLKRSSQTLSAGAVVSATAPTVPDDTLWFDSTGGQLYIKYNDGNTSQFVSATNLAGASVLTTVGLTGSLTDTLPTGTYDLGPVIQGGTVVNSYAHVASGTLTYTAAIGAPGSLINVTGMVALTASTTTSDTVGTATLNNVLTAGQHLWVIVAGTAAPGATVFLTVRVP